MSKKGEFCNVEVRKTMSIRVVHLLFDFLRSTYYHYRLTLSKLFGDVFSGRVLLPLDLVIADLGNDAEDLPHTQPVEVIESESALESLVHPQGCGQWSVCGAASFFGSAVGVSSPV